MTELRKSPDETPMDWVAFRERQAQEREILDLFRNLTPDEQGEMLSALAAGTMEALQGFGDYLRQSRGLPDDWPVRDEPK